MVDEVHTAVGALAAGLVTSVHCAGMCGPMACGLAALRKDDAERSRVAVGYHAGRLLSYGVIGGVAGFTGQAPLGKLVGTPALVLPWFLVLVFVGVALGVHVSLPRPKWFLRLSSVARAKLARVAAGKGAFFVGVGTPLLPCGPLYAMFGIALLSGSAARGMEFMLAFGLGTIPLLWVAQWQYHRLSGRVSPVTMSRVKRGVALTAAVMMVWRLWGTVPMLGGGEGVACPLCP